MKTCAEAKNEEIKEENDKKLRASNLIIHGVPEGNQPRDADRKFINELLETLGAPGTAKNVMRLGKKEEGKVRPIKVIMDNETSRAGALSSLANLKGLEVYKGVRVSKDFTVTEREHIRGLVKQANDLNEKEPVESPYEYKVRTSPKNGLVEVMRLKKRKTTWAEQKSTRKDRPPQKI